VVAAVAVLAVATATSSAAGPGGKTAKTVSATVTVTGMTFIPDRPSEVQALASSAAPSAPSETFTVTGPAELIDQLIDARAAESRRRLAQEATQPSTGEVTPSLISQLQGNCGFSLVELRGSGSQTQGQAYVRARFDLVGPTSTGAYTTDVMVYSNAALDLWTGHLKDSGNLNNALVWERSTRFDLPKTQNYGAHFYVGTVAVTMNGQSGVCSTVGPRVDNVKIYVS